MTSLNIKGLPNDVYELLVERATLHRRSAASEAKMILKETLRMWEISGIERPAPSKRRRPISGEEIVRIIRAHRDGQPWTGGPLTTGDD